MINWHYETDFKLLDEVYYADWISRILTLENVEIGQLDYVFCNDDYLLKLNQEYLNHDEYTDIITFNYNEGNTINGDIFISVPRVSENASLYGVDIKDELLRVMAHGALHLVGYGDKTEEEIVVMRAKENKMIELFHVEH